MYLLTVTIPCYNSAEYMAKAIESVLTGGDEGEILIVNDGSTKDDTPRIADDYAAKYPNIRALHKENGGHGDAVMTGLHNASGQYFKVLDSDDWVDTDAFCRTLEKLKAHTEQAGEVDLLLTNYVYDKVGAKHKFVVRYTHAFPQDKRFTWDEVGYFRVGQYIQMHSIIYRTGLLRGCGLKLPKHRV